MKTIKVSDEVHAKLTKLLGERIAKNGKIETYNDLLSDLVKDK
jgi:predicted CopG family antitoxin